MTDFPFLLNHISYRQEVLTIASTGHTKSARLLEDPSLSHAFTLIFHRVLDAQFVNE